MPRSDPSAANLPDGRHSLRAPGQRLAGLQALRGVAALAVTLFHANLLFGVGGIFTTHDLGQMFFSFHSGVILFFVLSGFIMLRSHWHDPPGWSSAVAFTRKRTVRIYPLVWVVVIALQLGAPLIRAVSGDESLAQISLLGWISSLTLVALDCTYMPGVLWSLSNEMVFYSICLLMFVGRAVFLWGYAALIVLICYKHLFSVDFGLFANCAGSVLSDYNVLFLFGLAAFFLSDRLGAAWRRHARQLVVMGGVGFVAVMAVEWWMFYATADANHGENLLKMALRIGYGLMSALLVLGATWNGFAVQGFAMKLLAMLGDASFALYLIHQPVMAVASRLMRDGLTAASLNPVLIFSILVGLSLCAGLALHRWVERPLVGWFNRRSRTATVAAI